MLTPRRDPNNEAALLSAPNTKAGKLQRACLDLLHEHNRKGDNPTNGRFLFYELEQRGVIPKNYEGVNPKTGKEWARTPLQDVSVATRRQNIADAAESLVVDFFTGGVVALVG